MHVSRIQGKAGGWRQGQDLGLWQRNRVCCSFWQWVTRAPGCTELFLYLFPLCLHARKTRRGTTLPLTSSPFRTWLIPESPSSEGNGILRPAPEAGAPLLTQKKDLHAPGHHPVRLHINWKDTCASLLRKMSWRKRSPSSSPAFTKNTPSQNVILESAKLPQPGPHPAVPLTVPPSADNNITAFPVCSETFQSLYSNLHEWVQITVPLSRYVRSLWG